MYNYIIVKLKYCDFLENCLLLLQSCCNYIFYTGFVFGIISRGQLFRGLGFDRENSIIDINYFTLAIFVHISELYVHILGDFVSLWFYESLLCVYAGCCKTPKDYVEKKT